MLEIEYYEKCSKNDPFRNRKTKLFSMTEDYVVQAHISYDLQDASEELSKLIEMIRPGEAIDEGEFNVVFAHLYWHLNSAWNARNLTSDDLESAHGERMNLLGQFPSDIKPL